MQLGDNLSFRFVRLSKALHTSGAGQGWNDKDLENDEVRNHTVCACVLFVLTVHEWVNRALFIMCFCLYLGPGSKDSENTYLASLHDWLFFFFFFFFGVHPAVKWFPYAITISYDLETLSIKHNRVNINPLCATLEPWSLDSLYYRNTRLRVNVRLLSGKILFLKKKKKKKKWDNLNVLAWGGTLCIHYTLFSNLFFWDFKNLKHL